ncbi:hypothetical protein D3C75_551680 [compost metagenome]
MVEERAGGVGLPPHQHAGPGGLGLADQGGDLVGGGGIDEGAYLGAFTHAIPHLEAAHRSGQLLGEGVMDAGLHQDAVGADAGLAGVAVFGGECPGHGGVEVGIVKHDEGGVATQLQGEPLHGVGALAHQQLADAGGAGEGELAHLGVAAQLVAHDRGLMGGDYVDDPGGNARLLGQGCQRQRAQGRLGGGLDDYGATGGECRAGLAGDHGDGEVPGGDGGHHAHRLLDGGQAPVAGETGNGAAIGALALFREPLDEAGAVGHLALGLGERLALLAGHDAGQFILIGHDEFEPGVKPAATLLGGEGGPGGLGIVSRRDGEPGVRLIHVGYLGDELAGRRVQDLETLSAMGLAPAAIYIGKGLDQGECGL